MNEIDKLSIFRFFSLHATKYHLHFADALWAHRGACLLPLLDLTWVYLN